jgi:hypothetical protein
MRVRRWVKEPLQPVCSTCVIWRDTHFTQQASLSAQAHTCCKRSVNLEMQHSTLQLAARTACKQHNQHSPHLIHDACGNLSTTQHSNAAASTPPSSPPSSPHASQ